MRITEAHDYDLIGTLDEPTETPTAAVRDAFPILALPSR
jgi:hypothetical protein